jgi:hypothetical protein
MPETDRSNTPVHISWEEWLRRTVSRDEITERYEARQPQLQAEPISLPSVRWPAPTTAVMTVAEAQTWIAFGYASKLDASTDFETTMRWKHTDLHRTLVAIEAIMAGSWVPATTKGTWPGETYAFHPAWNERGQEWIEGLRMHIGKQDKRDVSLDDLARMLRGEIARHQQAGLLLDRAEHELLEAQRAQKLTAYGRLHGNDRVQPIPVTLLMDGRIHLNWWGTIEGEWSGERWTDVVFPTADVLRLWPPAHADGPATDQESAEVNARNGRATEPCITAPADGGATKNLGGRPPKYDWAAFDREMIRLANIDGLPDRPALTCYMMDWCSDKWGADNVPAESKIREHIANRYP